MIRLHVCHEPMETLLGSPEVVHDGLQLGVHVPEESPGRPPARNTGGPALARLLIPECRERPLIPVGVPQYL